MAVRAVPVRAVPDIPEEIDRATGAHRGRGSGPTTMPPSGGVTTAALPGWGRRAAADRRDVARVESGITTVASGSNRRPELRAALPPAWTRTVDCPLSADTAAAGIGVTAAPLAEVAVDPDRDPAAPEDLRDRGREGEGLDPADLEVRS